MENGRILENFTRLADRGETSSSVIPTFRMNDDQVEKIAEFLHRWQQIEAELLPYHKLEIPSTGRWRHRTCLRVTVPLKDEGEMLKRSMDSSDSIRKGSI